MKHVMRGEHGYMIAMVDPYVMLNAEHKAGKHAAEAVVRHMNRMGASRGTIPVELDGKRYLVCVEEAMVVRVKPISNN